MPKKSRKNADRAAQEESTADTTETQPILNSGSNDRDATQEVDDSGDVRGRIDKSGLYDTQQVKRLLDDEVIAVCYPHA